MAVIKHHKYVSALPATLEADSIYYVRRGTGFDIYVTNSTGLVVAYPLNQAVDPWMTKAVGEPFGLWTHLAGVSIPPIDNPNYRYIKLTASDSYNDGVLTSESISGSAPHVQATAVISDAGSPLNGVTVQLVNTGRWLLRPGQSGVVELDAMQGHTFAGDANIRVRDVGYSIAGLGGTRLAALNAANPGNDLHIISDGTNGSPRIASGTRDKSIGEDIYMRIR